MGSLLLARILSPACFNLGVPVEFIIFRKTIRVEVYIWIFVAIISKDSVARVFQFNLGVPVEFIIYRKTIRVKVYIWIFVAIVNEDSVARVFQFGRACRIFIFRKNYSLPFFLYGMFCPIFRMVWYRIV